MGSRGSAYKRAARSTTRSYDTDSRFPCSNVSITRPQSTTSHSYCNWSLITTRCECRLDSQLGLSTHVYYILQKWHSMVAIKALLVTLATTVLAANADLDWHVSFTFEDGKQVTASGFRNSGCVNFGKTDSDIATIYFDSNINSDTVELYHQQGCRALAYTAGPGSSNVPNERYFSYQVY